MSNSELGFEMKCIYCPFSRPKNNFKVVHTCNCPLKTYSCPLKLPARLWPIKVINHIIALINKYPEILMKGKHIKVKI